MSFEEQYIEDAFKNVIDIAVPPPISKKIDNYSYVNSTIPSTMINDMGTKLLIKYFEAKGIGHDILESYNVLINRSIPAILEKIPIRISERVYMKAEPFWFKPTIADNGKMTNLLPKEARIRKTYLATLKVKFTTYQLVEDENGNLRQEKISESDKLTRVCKFPVMVRSILCHTYGMTRQELLEVGECPMDPGGYFLIGGTTERVINITEYLRRNRILIYMQNGAPVCQLTVKNIKNTSLLLIYNNNNIIRVLISGFPNRESYGNRKKKEFRENNLTVLQVLRLYGLTIGEFNKDVSMERLTEYIMTFVNPKYAEKVRLFLKATELKTSTISDDLEYVINTFKIFIPKGTNKEMKRIALNTFKQDFFPNMNKLKPKMKMYQLGLMTALYITHLVGARPLDERDSWSNKALKSPGKSLENVFTTIWSEAVNVIQQNISNFNNNYTEIENKFQTARMTDALTSFITKSGPEEGAISETLKRDSVIATYSSLYKLDAKTAMQTKSSEVRNVVFDQYGYISAAATPASQACGITKEKAITAEITTDKPEKFILDSVLHLIRDYPPGDLSEYRDSFVVNGKFIGWCIGPIIRDKILEIRRNGIMDGISVVYIEDDNTVLLHTDDGRLVRPLLIVDKKTEKLVIDDKNLWDKSFSELLTYGAIEYVDVIESEYEAYIAKDHKDIKFRISEIERITQEIEDLKSHKEELLSGKDLKIDKFLQDDSILENLESKKEKLDNEIIEIKTELETMNQKKKELALLIIDKSDIVERRRRVENINIINDKINNLNEELKIKSSQEKGLKLDIDKKITFAKKGKETLINDLDQQLNQAKDVLKNLLDHPYTHAELSPDAIFTFSESIIPYPETHQGTRNTYQTQMSKQALGSYNSFQMNRFDGNMKTLAFPNEPLLQTHLGCVTGSGSLPAGFTVTVAFMSWGGFNQEDGFILSEEAVKAGLGLVNIYHQIRESLKNTSEYTEKFGKPKIIKKEEEWKFSLLDEHGFPIPGKIAEEGMIIINIIRRSIEGKEINKSIPIGPSQEGIIERVLHTPNTDSGETLLVKLCQPKLPEKGDKFAFRFSQKGTITKILPKEQMPYIKGSDPPIRPDFIVNPHAIPTRMTIGFLKELIYSNLAALKGEINNATAFRKFKIQDGLKELEAISGNKFQLVEMINPITGKEIKTKIFFGLAYIQQLRHMVSQKIQGRSEGACKQSTRQPTRLHPQYREGGLRIGEMERDGLSSHAARHVLSERLCRSSDAYTTPVCTKCGRPFVILDVEKEDIKCLSCGDSAKFGKCTIPHPTKLLMHTFALGGIDFRFGFDPVKEPKEVDIFSSETLEDIIIEDLKDE